MTAMALMAVIIAWPSHLTIPGLHAETAVSAVWHVCVSSTPSEHVMRPSPSLPSFHGFQGGVQYSLQEPPCGTLSASSASAGRWRRSQSEAAQE